MDLLQRSIEIIQENQAPDGAYPASPNFNTYRYSWFRDGAFIAYAMDLVGEHDSAWRFHQWAATAIQVHAGIVSRAEEKMKNGEPLGAADILHTRYTLDGQEADDSGEEWPNFQLDGFGTWLWGLQEHLRLSGRPLSGLMNSAADLAARYLAALWRQPCNDCWEEYPQHIHTYTLAAIYAGLQAHTALSGMDHSLLCAEIRNCVENDLVYDGYFVKFKGSYTVDASLLGLSTPYNMLPTEDKRIQETIQRIEQTLVRGGGVHRYSTDTYYGGGEWVLLAGWLGWHLARSGQRLPARRLLDWMANQANQNGELPEQVPATLIDANYYAPWQRRWGEIARPLLWSHAKYIILHLALEQ